MRKKISVSVAIGLAFIAIGLAVFWPRNEGPLYNGKPVSYWMRHPMKETLVGFDGGTTFLKFPKFDSEAVPYLVKAVESKDGRAKVFYIHVWERSPAGIRKGLPQPVPALLIKRNAAVALGGLGSEAKPAIPALLRAIKEDDDIVITAWAVTVIEHCGGEKDLHEALVTASSSTNSLVREYARGVFARHGGADGPF